MMRTIGHFTISLCLGLLVTGSAVSARELGTLAECSCCALTDLSTTSCDVCDDKGYLMAGEIPQT